MEFYDIEIKATDGQTYLVRIDRKSDLFTKAPITKAEREKYLEEKLAFAINTFSDVSKKNKNLASNVIFILPKNNPDVSYAAINSGLPDSPEYKEPSLYLNEVSLKEKNYYALYSVFEHELSHARNKDLSAGVSLKFLSDKIERFDNFFSAMENGELISIKDSVIKEEFSDFITKAKKFKDFCDRNQLNLKDRMGLNESLKNQGLYEEYINNINTLGQLYIANLVMKLPGENSQKEQFSEAELIKQYKELQGFLSDIKEIKKIQELKADISASYPNAASTLLEKLDLINREHELKAIEEFAKLIEGLALKGIKYRPIKESHPNFSERYAELDCIREQRTKELYKKSISAEFGNKLPSISEKELEGIISAGGIIKDHGGIVDFTNTKEIQTLTIGSDIYNVAYENTEVGKNLKS